MATKQKQAQILALARQAAEQGIGDNDLKRLQRQFDSNKSTFINIDQKQRFMKGAFPACLLARKEGNVQKQGGHTRTPQLTDPHARLLLFRVKACGTLSLTLSS